VRTCDAALSEAFFLLQRTHGGADRLLELLERRLVISAFSLVGELRAVGQLLRRYQSVPMSLADACLVRMAELHHDAFVLTLDSDFRIYRNTGVSQISLSTQIDALSNDAGEKSPLSARSATANAAGARNLTEENESFVVFAAWN